MPDSPSAHSATVNPRRCPWVLACVLLLWLACRTHAAVIVSTPQQLAAALGAAADDDVHIMGTLALGASQLLSGTIVLTGASQADGIGVVDTGGGVSIGCAAGVHCALARCRHGMICTRSSLLRALRARDASAARPQTASFSLPTRPGAQLVLKGPLHLVAARGTAGTAVPPLAAAVVIAALGGAALGALTAAGAMLAIARRRGARRAGTDSGADARGKALLPVSVQWRQAHGPRRAPEPDEAMNGLVYALREASVLASQMHGRQAASSAGPASRQPSSLLPPDPWSGAAATAVVGAADGRHAAHSSDRLPTQRQLDSAAAAAVQELQHADSSWQAGLPQQEIVLESVLGEGSFGMVRFLGVGWERRVRAGPSPACSGLSDRRLRGEGGDRAAAAPRLGCAASQLPNPARAPPGLQSAVEGLPRGGEAHAAAGRDDGRGQARAHGHHGDRDILAPAPPQHRPALRLLPAPAGGGAARRGQQARRQRGCELCVSARGAGGHLEGPWRAQAHTQDSLQPDREHNPT